MTILQRTPIAAVYNPANQAGTVKYLDVIEARVRIDERAVPMYQYDVTVAAPTPAVEAMLDPAAGNWFVIASAYVTDPSFKRDTSWGGLVASTTRNGDGTLRVVAVSPDTRLIEYAPAADDATCKGYQSDVRTIWHYVLDKVFGPEFTGWMQLSQPSGEGTGVALTPFPTYRAVTNLMPNGGFDYGTTGWSGNNATIGQATSWSTAGGKSLYIIPSTSSNDSYAFTYVSLEPSTTYTIIADFQNGASAMNVNVNARARRMVVTAVAGGATSIIGGTAAGANTAYGRSRLSVTFTTPALLDSSGHRVLLFNGTQSGSSSVTTYWDSVIMVEGNGLDTDQATQISYFDGDTVDGTAGYNYDWQSTAGSSSATRTPIIDRDEDVLVWKAGQTAYDFLRPIMETFGYRSLAVESLLPLPSNGVGVPAFRFVTSLFAGNVGGITQVAQGRNLYALDTGQSRSDEFTDGTPMFADAVILRYTWRDSLNVDRTATDAYTPAGYRKPYYLELEQPYPGPGRAKSLYARLIARRRTYQATYRLQVNAQPGMQVSITSDQLAGPVLGQADTVEHDLVAGTTTITTKNTVAFPTSAWLRLPAGESWNASPTGASWTAETLS